jgi:hypothetical protein
METHSDAPFPAFLRGRRRPGVAGLVFHILDLQLLLREAAKCHLLKPVLRPMYRWVASSLPILTQGLSAWRKAPVLLSEHTELSYCSL